MSLLAWLADQELERAVAAGVFDKFDVKGKPRQPSLWADPHEGDWEMAFRMMRQAQVAPRWIELDNDIRQRTHSFRTWLLEQPTATALDGYYQIDCVSGRLVRSRQLTAILNCATSWPRQQSSQGFRCASKTN